MCLIIIHLFKMNLCFLCAILFFLKGFYFHLLTSLVEQGMHWIILILGEFYIWLNILFSDSLQTAFYYASRNENENIANLLLEYTKVRKK